MPRIKKEKNITRTFTFTEGTALCMNIETRQPDTLQFRVVGSLEGEKLVAAVKANYGTSTIIPVAITECHTLEKLIAVPESVFLSVGTVVEKGIMFTATGSTESKKIAMTKPGTQFTVVADENGTYKGYAVVKGEDNSYTLITDGSVTITD